jgi:hypothetical protein
LRAGDSAQAESRPQAAGRLCPPDYRYSPAVLDRAAELSATTLYIVGGLYGNLSALDAVERLARGEPAPAVIVFNGDFHWFDTAPKWFADIERGVARHRTLRGNVETEISRRDDIGAGCGCAYPETVDDGVVQRSNDILAELKGVAATLPAVRERLAGLPMHLVAKVGSLRIGIVHGDAVSLAGWGFAQERLDARDAPSWLAGVQRRSHIDVFASTHTCAAALRNFSLPSGHLTVINNGAAGMANFAGTRFGVVSRISTLPSPRPALYGIVRDGVHVDAIALDDDPGGFLDQFVKRWPPGSPAHLSYYRRITCGPDYKVEQAWPAAGVLRPGHD